MTGNWEFFLFLTIICLIIQAFYAMMEMACVSFNKVRLQYYVSIGNRRAKWLSYLLNHPAQLFGTVLILITTSLFVGSEASRRFYEALGYSPEWAIITQVVVVLIFAEISPLIAARRYAEHVVMLGMPILYFSSVLLYPLTFLFDLLVKTTNRLLNAPPTTSYFLTRDELQKILEEHEETEPEEFQKLVSNIFSLRNKTAKELMLDITKVHMIPSNSTVADTRQLLMKTYVPYLPIYHREMQNIIAIVYPRDLIRIPEESRVRDEARPPWFITEDNSILHILRQFRRNNQSMAVVLNSAGLAVGILTLDSIIDEIFHLEDDWDPFADVEPHIHDVLVEKSFSGDMLITDFNKQFHAHLPSAPGETLEELVMSALGHPPVKGEMVRIDEFEITVEETSLLGIKTVSIKSL